MTICHPPSHVSDFINSSTEWRWGIKWPYKCKALGNEGAPGEPKLASGSDPSSDSKAERIWILKLFRSLAHPYLPSPSRHTCCPLHRPGGAGEGRHNLTLTASGTNQSTRLQQRANHRASWIPLLWAPTKPPLWLRDRRGLLERKPREDE